MAELLALEYLLRRDRLIVAVGLAAVVALAWVYLATGAGMDASMADMSMDMDMDMPMPWSPAYAVLAFVMWWVMMAGMMLPGAAPMILTFATINRSWKSGDVVELRLPMTPEIIRGFHDSLSMRRGPLVFSLAMEEDWLKLRDRGQASDWQVYPASEWSYAIATNEHDGKAISVQESPVGMPPCQKISRYQSTVPDQGNIARRCGGCWSAALNCSIAK